MRVKILGFVLGLALVGARGLHAADPSKVTHSATGNNPLLGDRWILSNDNIVGNFHGDMGEFRGGTCNLTKITANSRYKLFIMMSHGEMDGVTESLLSKTTPARAPLGLFDRTAQLKTMTSPPWADSDYVVTGYCQAATGKTQPSAAQIVGDAFRKKTLGAIGNFHPSLGVVTVDDAMLREIYSPKSVERLVKMGKLIPLPDNHPLRLQFKDTRYIMSDSANSYAIYDPDRGTFKACTRPQVMEMLGFDKVVAVEDLVKATSAKDFSTLVAKQAEQALSDAEKLSVKHAIDRMKPSQTPPRSQRVFSVLDRTAMGAGLALTPYNMMPEQMQVDRFGYKGQVCVRGLEGGLGIYALARAPGPTLAALPISLLTFSVAEGIARQNIRNVSGILDNFEKTAEAKGMTQRETEQALAPIAPMWGALSSGHAMQAATSGADFLSDTGGPRNRNDFREFRTKSFGEAKIDFLTHLGFVRKTWGVTFVYNGEGKPGSYSDNDLIEKCKEQGGRLASSRELDWIWTNNYSFLTFLASAGQTEHWAEVATRTRKDGKRKYRIVYKENGSYLLGNGDYSPAVIRLDPRPFFGICIHPNFPPGYLND